jgi:thiol:disulfide interchange protein
MVDFSASWCTPCAELELTFAEDGVYETLVDHFVPLKFDVSEDNADSQAKKKTYGVGGSLPNVVFVVFDGDEAKVIGRVDQDTPNYLDASGFMKVAQPAADEVARRRGTLSAN